MTRDVQPIAASLISETLEGRRDSRIDPTMTARFINVSGLPIFRRYPLTESTEASVLAEMMGCSSNEAESILTALAIELDANIKQALKQPEVAVALGSIPFEPQQRVLAIGDSITADRLGWAEMMANLPERQFDLFNLGVGGQTSADVVSQMDIYGQFEPHWVLLMIGTNDFRYHSDQTAAQMVSQAESRRNLGLIRRLVEHELGANLVAVTPPPAASGVVAASGPSAVGWTEGGDTAMAGYVRTMFPSHIDIHEPLIIQRTSQVLYEEDGIHPNPTGQKLIFSEIVRGLAALPCPVVGT